MTSSARRGLGTLSVGVNGAADARQLTAATQRCSNEQLDEVGGDLVGKLGGADAHCRPRVAVLSSEGVVAKHAHLLAWVGAAVGQLDVQVRPDVGGLAVREPEAAVGGGVDAMRVAPHEGTMTEMTHGILDDPSGWHTGLDGADACLHHAVRRGEVAHADRLRNGVLGAGR